MIWNSVPAMIAIDLAIICATGYLATTWFRRRRVLEEQGLGFEFVLLNFGLIIFALFYLVELLSMTVAPIFLSRPQAMAMMETLHLEVKWIVSLVSVGAIALGSVRAIKAVSLRNRRLHAEIDERRRAESELEKSRDLLELILEHTPAGILVVDADMKIAACNTGRADLMELPENLLEPGRPFEDLVRYRAMQGGYGAGDTEALVAKRMAEFSRPDGFRDVPRRGNGAMVEVDSNPLPGGGFIRVYHDVAERQRADEDLRASQRLLRTVFDSIPHWVFAKDKESHYIMVNRAFAESYNLRPEDFVGKHTHEVPTGTESELKKFVATDRQVLDSGSPLNVDYSVHLPGGRVRINHVHKAPLRDDEGNVVGLVGVAEDITERKQADAERARLAAALEQAGDCIFITDPKGVIEYVNPAFTRITGYAAGEALGQTPRILKSGAMGGDFYPRLWATLSKGEVFKARYTNRRKDGTFYEAEATHSPVFDEQGSITHFVSVQKDVTEETRLQEQLRRAQRMEAIGKLAGGIAHDFNNILMPILGYTDLISEELPPQGDSQAYLEVIRKAALRAKDLVAQILVFSRGKENFRQNVMLAPIAGEVLKLMRSTLPATISIRKVFSGQLPAVLADATQIHQVLMNLCVNAGHAMPEGGELTVALEEVTLEEHPVLYGRKISGKFVRIEVSDTGVGMDEETLEHIFEPFFTAKEEGTGLGLSTVHGIVEQNEGFLEVRSRPGEGSTFAVFLAPQPHRQPSAAPPVGEVAGGSEAILLVDDEQPITELGRKVLEDAGYRVTALSDSLEALEVFRLAPDAFDLVVTDQTMPGLTGEGLAREIWRVRPGLPVVLCTGFSETLTPERAEREGFAGYLAKPISSWELKETTRRVLDAQGEKGE